MSPVLRPGYISPHFSLVEMRASDTAARKGIDNTPGADVLRNLERLCWGFLEPLREKFGPIRITSGYRCAALNSLIGGSPTSFHMLGLAADFQPTDPSVTLKGVVDWLQAGPLVYDQAIYEFGAWVHLGIPAKHRAPRRQTLMVFRDTGYQPYDPTDTRVG